MKSRYTILYSELEALTHEDEQGRKHQKTLNECLQAIQQKTAKEEEEEKKSSEHTGKGKANKKSYSFETFCAWNKKYEEEKSDAVKDDKTGRKTRQSGNEDDEKKSSGERTVLKRERLTRCLKKIHLHTKCFVLGKRKNLML